MDKNEFRLRGKVVQMARNLKNVNSNEFAKKVDINPTTFYALEEEARSISPLNQIRIRRGLNEIGVSDAQIACIQIIVEHDEGRFDE
ncbi:hypothetical protein [Priestia endophytica]|uniref:hypothetical protein n=1 Tax=Priestia endophytica TaxID=135735 RepID=UPI002280D3CB|nr:hypothetical protein [Priestia endophytica]MCY8233695.1 hypothetical protein [Priestia endophytica]